MKTETIITAMAASLPLSIMIVVAIIIALLPIILFFKIWDMTNDVAKIKEMMEDKAWKEEEEEEAKAKAETPKVPREPKKESTFWVWNKVPFRRVKKDEAKSDPNMLTPRPADFVINKVDGGE